MGKLQAIEDELQKLLAAKGKRKLVVPLSLVRSAAFLGTATTPLAARSTDFVTFQKLLITRRDDVACPARPVLKHGFGNVLGGNRYFLAALHVGDGAAVDRLLHRALDVLAVTLQKALPIDRALVLSVRSAINKVCLLYTSDAADE